MKTLMEKLRKFAEKLDNLVLLLIRLILAYGFYTPAKMKWKDIHAIGDWFAGMNYPLPMVNAYLAGITEAAGVVLLFLGLGSSLISIPLIIVMLVAIFTVHIGNGFNAGDNGFEIPLYYIAMLLTLFAFGSGKFSIDQLFTKKK